jgi:hypothetical protein
LAIVITSVPYGLHLSPSMVIFLLRHFVVLLFRWRGEAVWGAKRCAHYVEAGVKEHS